MNNFVLDVAVVIGLFCVLYACKSPIARTITRIPLPATVLALAWAFPVILVEESINCIDYNDGHGCRMTWWINLVLMVEVLILVLIARKIQTRTIIWPLLFFALFGLAWEVLVGGLSGIIFSPFILFMGPYVMISYALIAVIPLQIIQIRKEKPPLE